MQAQGDVNPHILRMLEGTVSLYAAQMMYSVSKKLADIFVLSCLSLKFFQPKMKHYLIMHSN